MHQWRGWPFLALEAEYHSMHKIIFIQFVVLSISWQACNLAAPRAEDEAHSDHFELVWADEFEEEGAPDPKNWTFEQGFSRNEEWQWYQPDNAFVEDGKLIIEARRETIQNPNYREGSSDWKTNRREARYTSSCLTTRGLHAWQYGRFEIKARIKTQEGLWPAIWTLGLGHEWPIGGEIDIMEYYGGNILANAAWAGEQRWKAIWDDHRQPVSSFNAPDWDTKFHIWKMEWNEEAIDIYLDEQLLNSIPLGETINQRGKLSNPFRESKHYLLLNLAVGGTNGGDPSATPFPSRYEIDYVRVYQKK